MRMKYLSLFSGIGGFDLGIGKRAQCVGYSEIDKFANQVYKKHFKDHKNYGDIKKIYAGKLPNFDLLVGGFPCQTFSIAGKRAGLDDPRGKLFFEIARIIEQKQPRLLLFENVAGLLSHNQGGTFAKFIATLDVLGYHVEWQSLNSKNYGVPQNRERVFIVGHSRGRSRPKIFPFQGENNQNNTVEKSTKSAVARTLTAGGHSGGNHSGMTIITLNNPKHSNERIYSTKGISPTLNTMQGGLRQPFIKVGKKYRRLTPVECERLQGFPDGWTDCLSDTQRFKTIGNAVTVNVVKAIIKKLL